MNINCFFNQCHFSYQIKLSYRLISMSVFYLFTFIKFYFKNTGAGVFQNRHPCDIIVFQ